MEYQLNDIFYLDETYSSRVKFCNDNNYKIEEVEADEKGRRFQIKEKDESNTPEIELMKLMIWFDKYFEKQLLQSTWQSNFTISHDDYFEKDYSTIEELKAQGEIVRVKVKELKKDIAERLSNGNI